MRCNCVWTSLPTCWLNRNSLCRPRWATFTGLAASGVIAAELAGKLRRAVGFRNIAVHNYEAIDWDIVFALTGEPLSDFEQFAAAVAMALK